jgi:hypothetical protein
VYLKIATATVDAHGMATVVAMLSMMEMSTPLSENGGDDGGYDDGGGYGDGGGYEYFATSTNAFKRLSALRWMFRAYHGVLYMVFGKTVH